MLKTLLGSKKFIVALAGVLFVLLNELAGLDISEAAVLQILGIVTAYILGQGVADIGKEAAKVPNDS